MPVLMRSAVIVLVSLLLAAPGGTTTASTAASSAVFPPIIALPDGFQPEGIAIAPGGTFFVGSLANGAIYRGDLRTGVGVVLPTPPAGRVAVGLAVDHRGRLFVAGGPTGQAYVYDAATGAEVAAYQLTTNSTFINDVVVTRTAAWFTDSVNPVLYRVPIAPDGTLGSQADVDVVPLSGDIVYAAGFNVNGIDATPNGKTLVIVQSNTGALFTVDPASGVTRRIDLGGASVARGDGLLLDGQTLYVVQNAFNQIAVVALAPDLSTGTVITHLTSTAFDIPTTIAELGHRLYAVNARFSTPPTPATSYTVVQLPKPAGS